MATAGERLATTLELAEMILFELPTQDLLLAQRVCKTWQQLIANSSDLQRALFFKPAKEGTVCWVDLFDEQCELERPYENRYCKYYHPPEDDDYEGHYGKSVDDYNQYLMFRNPLIDLKIPFITPLAEGYGTLKPPLTAKRLGDLTDLPQALARPEASWRKMLYSQPAISSTLMGDGEESFTNMLMEDNEGHGIRLGEVYDTAVELGGDCAIRENQWPCSWLKWQSGRDLFRIYNPAE